MIKLLFLISVVCMVKSVLSDNLVTKNETYWRILGDASDCQHDDCNLIEIRKCWDINDEVMDCPSGIIKREYRHCPVDIMRSDFVDHKVLRQCSNNCDQLMNVESIYSNNTSCTQREFSLCNCTSQWSDWSNFGPCSSTCDGIRTSTRSCYDTLTNEMSNKCKGAKGETTQTFNIKCNAETCIPVLDEPSGTTNAHPPNSQFGCGTCIDHVGQLSHDDVLEVCQNQRMMKSIDIENCISKTEVFRISCSGSKQCEWIQTDDCDTQFKWEPWGTWLQNNDIFYGVKGQRRYRKRSCAIASSNVVTSQCSISVVLETQCDLQSAPPAADQSLAALVAGIILVIAVFIFGCICGFCIYRIRKRKLIENNPTQQIQLQGVGNNSDDYSSTSHSYVEPNTSPRHDRSFSIIGHIVRVREHVYEIVSKKNTSFLSQRNKNISHVSNEYIVQDGGPSQNSNTRGHSAAPNVNMTLKVINPDGKEVIKDTVSRNNTFASAATNQTNAYSRKMSSSGFQSKLQNYLTMRATKRKQANALKNMSPSMKMKQTNFIGKRELRNHPILNRRFHFDNDSYNPTVEEFSHQFDKDKTATNSHLPIYRNANKKPHVWLRRSVRIPLEEMEATTSFPGNEVTIDDVNGVDPNIAKLKSCNYLEVANSHTSDYSDGQSWVELGEAPQPFVPDYDNCHSLPDRDSSTRSYETPTPLPPNLSLNRDGLSRDKYGYINLNLMKNGAKTEAKI